MKNKGFTLIELLAVIVILAIIALIATPIILNIINDARIKANERSVELYADAVKNAVANHLLLNPYATFKGEFKSSEDGKTLTQNDITLTVDYSGNRVKCETVNITEKGRIQLSGCVVSNGNSEYTYDEDDGVKEEIPEIPDSSQNAFATDSWDTIAQNVRDGNISQYNVGDTRTVDMGSYGVHTVRIANTTTPSECSTTGFSQTACGFVIEFADIITKHVMNSTKTNKGGWPASEMYTFVQNDIYNALPSDLKNIIIPTYVVSGHGSTSGEENFVTQQDKLYLLSGKEVHGEDAYDTSANLTRQLEYYSNLGVTNNNYSGAKKNFNVTSGYWWLRSAKSNSTDTFKGVDYSGSLSSYYSAPYANGVAVAFRIG